MKSPDRFSKMTEHSQLKLPMLALKNSHHMQEEPVAMLVKINRMLQLLMRRNIEQLKARVDQGGGLMNS